MTNASGSGRQLPVGAHGAGAGGRHSVGTPRDRAGQEPGAGTGGSPLSVMAAGFWGARHPEGREQTWPQ